MAETFIFPAFRVIRTTVFSACFYSLLLFTPLQIKCSSELLKGVPAHSDMKTTNPFPFSKDMSCAFTRRRANAFTDKLNVLGFVLFCCPPQLVFFPFLTLFLLPDCRGANGQTGASQTQHEQFIRCNVTHASIFMVQWTSKWKDAPLPQRSDATQGNELFFSQFSPVDTEYLYMNTEQP